MNKSIKMKKDKILKLKNDFEIVLCDEKFQKCFLERTQT